MAGMKVVLVSCDENGNVDMQDLKEKVETHSSDLAAIMVTYPQHTACLKHPLSSSAL